MEIPVTIYIHGRVRPKGKRIIVVGRFLLNREGVERRGKKERKGAWTPVPVSSGENNRGRKTELRGDFSRHYPVSSSRFNILFPFPRLFQFGTWMPPLSR